MDRLGRGSARVLTVALGRLETAAPIDSMREEANRRLAER